MSANDPLRTFQRKLGLTMTRQFRAIIAVSVGLAACGQNLPTKPLVDGCYYMDAVPVMRVDGRAGKLLVPGNVSQVAVERFAPKDGTWSGQAWVTFTPGFKIRINPLSVIETPERSSVAMKPGTDLPTIWPIAETNEDLELVLGSDC